MEAALRAAPVATEVAAIVDRAKSPMPPDEDLPFKVVRTNAHDEVIARAANLLVGRAQALRGVSYAAQKVRGAGDATPKILAGVVWEQVVVLRIGLGNSVTMSSGRHARRLQSHATPQIGVVPVPEGQLASPGCSKGDWERATCNVPAAARTTAQNAYASNATKCQALQEETIAWRQGGCIRRIGSIIGAGRG